MDRNEASKFCNPEWTEKSYYLCAFRRIVIRRPVQQSKTIPFRMPWQLNHGVVERIWIQSLQKCGFQRQGSVSSDGVNRFLQDHLHAYNDMHHRCYIQQFCVREFP